MRHARLHARLPEFTAALTGTYDQGPLRGHNLEPRHTLPSRRAVISILHRLFEAFFPGFVDKQYLTRDNVSFHIGALLDEVADALSDQVYAAARHERSEWAEQRDEALRFAEEAVIHLFERLPELRRLLILDVNAAFDGDPAAKSFNEIILSYPCIVAIATYRIAHELERAGVPLLPRIAGEWAHAQTGIDIHPGARIGERFFIDHGTGVVIGETTIIGTRVKIYQGVTLGALSFPKDERGKLIRGLRRHPELGDDVVIYGGATILGDVTIGEGAVIGGNVWLTESVPPHTKVINSPQAPRFQRRSE
ncbi:MAG: serine acetyltransferase [Candidatus Eisenbacteria bacterium]|nr:serine acetyltransferase [Candidatus Eisenbacteria bacterium]